VCKLLDAAVEELVHAPYGELTVRSVAARAGVSPSTAYTYFPSKDALIGEVYLRFMRDAEIFTDVNMTTIERVTAQLREMALLIADKPRLANACTSALMADDAGANEARTKIAWEISRRITAALGPGHSPAVAEFLHMAFTGALVHARSTVGGYTQVAERLECAVSLVLASGSASSQRGFVPFSVLSGPAT